jgi:hypothetical protein
VFAPPGPATVRKTLYVPGLVKVCTGFGRVLVEPSLNAEEP